MSERLLNDVDPIETRDWQQAIESVIREEGVERAQHVGIGVAMGNAKDEVKAKADFVCQSVENDGIYHYCVENKLIF